MMPERRKIQLEALLEVTQAINANILQEDLFKVFEFTCKSLMVDTEVSLYVRENGVLIPKFISNPVFSDEVLTELLEADIELGHVQKRYPEVNAIFPIRHKKRLLAILVIGNVSVNNVNSTFSFIRTLSNLVMVAVENKRLAKIALVQEGIRKESEIARSVQELLIPSNLPNNEYLNIAATYLPHRSVGGDYYDVIVLNPDQYLFCIADVSGKGVPAALIMSNFQASLRALARVSKNLDDLLRDVNTQLLENTRSDHFVTCFLAIYTPSSHQLEYVNAGHNAPVYVEKEVFKRLESMTCMLGVFDDLPAFNSRTIDVSSGSKLFLYTDGITETTNNQGEEYGEERLVTFLTKTLSDELKFNLADLIVDLDAFKQEQDYRDDLTALNIRFQ